MKKRAAKLLGVFFAGSLLVACNGVFDSSIPKHERPVPEHLIKAMKAKGMPSRAPILLRIYKEENVLEVWKQDHTKRYAFLTSYEICKWSGKLGPKLQEGDRQAPEGFYHVTPALMNPNSEYHLSFNMGFPNTYDRANGRTGSYLMIHGACSSAGCYSMTDEYVEEIFSMAREAFKGGQKAFQIQAYPFRMTAENLAKKTDHPDFEFWKMLKEGSDHFEVTNLPPKVDVCERRYVFNRYLDEGNSFRSTAQCPTSKMPRSLALAFNQKQQQDQSEFQKILTSSANSFWSGDSNRTNTSLSILANGTQGAVELFDPTPPSAEPETTENGNGATANTSQREPSASETQTAASQSVSVQQIAVPSRANRQLVSNN